MIINYYCKICRYLLTNKIIMLSELAELLYKKVFSLFNLFNLFKSIVFNHKSVFISEFWLKICYYVKIKCRLSTAFYPQMNNQTECQNQTLKHYLRMYYTENQSDWVKLLPLTKFSYNNAKQVFLRCFSFYIMYSYHSQIHYNIKNKTKKRKILTAEDTIKCMNKI